MTTTINHSKASEAVIQVGSKVRFIDGSYTLSIKSDSFELKHCSEGLRQDVLTVIAINVDCPTYNTKEALQYKNNCIVKSDSGDIIFCSNINIMNVKKIF